MDTIKILGAQDHIETKRLFSNVQKALQQLNLRLSPLLVDDIDTLIDHKVEKIPALMVRGQVVSQRYIPDENALEYFFKTVFLPEKKSIPMKNILVPTDFSNTSKHAFEFAKALADRANANLHVLHVHYPQAHSMDGGPLELFAEGLKIKGQKLRSFVKKDPAWIQEKEANVLIKTKTEVAIGFPGENIVEHSKKEDVDLIVMGTTGENGLLEKVFGSVSSHVARKAHCPVLLVPAGVSLEPCKNILFATDKKSTDETMVENIPNLLACPEADVHFAHVNETKKESYQVKDISFFNPDLSGQFHFVEIESSNVLDALNRYAKDQQVDAMVMVTTRRPFFEELFHKSMTKQMALNTQMPLLVMHDTD